MNGPETVPTGAVQTDRTGPTAHADHFVRPDVQNFLDILKQHPRPTFTAENIAALRPQTAAGMAMIDLPPGELAEVRDLVAEGPGGPLALRLFDARAEREPGPVVVYFHGGGFVIGNIEGWSGICAEIARTLDLPVVSVEYRLAPEHPWPAAPDDAEFAARWVAQNPSALGREVTGLVLSGDSAGGTLTLVTALALRNEPAAVPLVLQIPLYPGADFDGDYESGRLFANGYGLDAADTVFYSESYRSDGSHWRSAPLLADLAGMAPMVLATASLDPLRDQGRAFAAKAVAAGVPTTFYEADGMIHGFANFRRIIASAQADLTNVLRLATARLAVID